MRVPGKKFLVRNARWVRSRFSGGALILGYHRIVDDKDDVYSICVHPRHFAEHMAILRRFAEPISLEDLVQALYEDKVPRRAVVVTFDDGYADNLSNARPILDKFQIPATFFVATGYLGRRFWWDELSGLVFSNRNLPPKLFIDVDGESGEWSFNGHEGGGYNQFYQLYQYFLGLTSKQQQAALGQVHQQFGSSGGVANDDRCALTQKELTELATDSLVSIGSHTVSHPMLTDITLPAKRKEITQSKDDLENLLGIRVKAFSYPNGAKDDESRAILKESGYEFACSSMNDVTRRGTDPFDLPRFWVPDQGGGTFYRWLQHWLTN